MLQPHFFCQIIALPTLCWRIKPRCLRFVPMMFWRLSIFKFRPTFRVFPASVCLTVGVARDEQVQTMVVMLTATSSTVARQNKLITAHLGKNFWDPEVGDLPECVGSEGKNWPSILGNCMSQTSVIPRQKSNRCVWVSYFSSFQKMLNLARGAASA